MIELHAYGYTARIDPDRGGNCLCLNRFGADVLRTPASDADREREPFFFGTPLLFFPNRISGGRFEFEGREYRLPVNEPSTGCFLHGTMHQAAFKVIRQNEQSVLLRYMATDEEPYLTFPHAFEVDQEWGLSSEGLQQTVTVTNLSRLDMPVALGSHTTFRLPFTAGSRAEAVTMQLDTDLEYSRNMTNYLPDGKCSRQYPDQDALKQGTFVPAPHRMSRLFRMGKNRDLVLTDPESAIRMTYSALKGYGYWMVYNGISPDFLCVEPQSWLSNCPNAPFPRNETGFDFLTPGENRVYETNLSMEPVSR